MSITPIFSVIVAALAVVVSAVMQHMTLKTTRQNTLSGLRVGVTESAIDGLKTALAKHITLTYSMDSNYKGFKYNGRPLPPDHYDEAIKEDRLFNLIRLNLNPDEPTHMLLLESINELRNGDSQELWTTRRDQVIARATAAFARDRQKTLGLQHYS